MDVPWSESGTVVNPILSWSTVSPGPPRDCGGKNTRRRRRRKGRESIDISRAG